MAYSGVGAGVGARVKAGVEAASEVVALTEEVEVTLAGCALRCLRRVSLFSKYISVTQKGQQNP